MLGETTIGTYIAYAGFILLLLIFVLAFLRLAIMLSLLFLKPGAMFLRRLRGIEEPTDDVPSSREDSQSSR